MTAEPVNSPGEYRHVDSADQPVAAAAGGVTADVDKDCGHGHRHRSATSPVNRDDDPWLLPRLANDEGPRWNGTSTYHPLPFFS